MQLSNIHPQRNRLNDEVHARPSEAIHNPVRIIYLAVMTPWTIRPDDCMPIRLLADRFGVTPPELGVNHFHGDFGPFRLKWERHTEFTRYRFTVEGVDDDPFASSALDAVPDDWVRDLPGEVIFAARGVLLNVGDRSFDYEDVSKRYFNGNVVVGSEVGGGAGRVFTDFRIHPDGFNRIVIHNKSMTPWQAGRILQGVLEMETYRILSLLALPVAQAEIPIVARHEEELAQITTLMAASETVAEPFLLDRLTRLQSDIESRHSDTHYRFSAAAAYYELVQRRIADLREQHMAGMQTLAEFTARRLGPAIATSHTVANRQTSLSERVARATQLLSTRVDLTLEQQNQELLETMNRRAAIQLRQQQAIEGLSVVAVTYYVVGLIGYGAKGLKTAGIGIDPDLAVGISIPIVILLVALGISRIRALFKTAKSQKRD